jgi:hypothetical protein
MGTPVQRSIAEWQEHFLDSEHIGGQNVERAEVAAFGRKFDARKKLALVRHPLWRTPGVIGVNHPK